MESRGRPDKAGEGYGDESLILKSEATYFGPAFMINWLKTDYKGFLTDVVLINCNVPTSSSSFTLQYGLKVRKPPGLDDATVDYIAGRYRDMFGSGFLQDVAIWLNKAPVENPLLCEEDGAVYQLRRWYEQFYVDVADVTPEMTARFEFEVDTTRANEYWREEVARNLADAVPAEPAT
jgi:3-ketosteroid 9alpha-monooxygenase subunit A